VALLAQHRARTTKELEYLQYHIEAGSTKKRFNLAMGGPIKPANPVLAQSIARIGEATKLLLTEKEFRDSSERISRVVLSAFADSRCGFIDVVALDIIMACGYLKYRDKSKVAPRKSSWHINEIVALFTPSRSLSWRVFIRGLLPDKLLLQAAMTTMWLESVQRSLAKELIYAYRKDHNAPRRYCPLCLEPMALDEHFAEHISGFHLMHAHTSFTTFENCCSELLGEGEGFDCPRSGRWASWIGPEAFRSMRARLEKECKRLDGGILLR